MSAGKIIFEHILGQMEPIFYSPYKDISFEWLIIAGGVLLQNRSSGQSKTT